MRKRRRGCWFIQRAALQNWTRAKHFQSATLGERLVIYAGSAPSACFRLPHQLMAPVDAGPFGSPMDFLGELRRAQRNANTNFST
ncbi:hypothetical protein CIPAW_16G094700 [Carya illinoinensis]|uniref:Uncharacterized protein n=1 Tax=Carya illinoinensis TaxID=32201 RepID=A0A8T1N8B1_CARIL|nr:hypothetical protein CIPAW_16G094700 [Carya illinoinensis]